MSGGFFGQKKYQIRLVAEEIDELILSNDDQSKDGWGQEGNNFPPEIIEKFQEAAHALRRAEEMAHRIDWLVSGDDGEESFLERWDKEVRPNWREHIQKPHH